MTHAPGARQLLCWQAVPTATPPGMVIRAAQAEHAERQRQAVLAEQALIREQGVSAVEIIPDGQEAATCQAVAEAAFIRLSVDHVVAHGDVGHL